MLKSTQIEGGPETEFDTKVYKQNKQLKDPRKL